MTKELGQLILACVLKDSVAPFVWKTFLTIRFPDKWCSRVLLADKINNISFKATKSRREPSSQSLSQMLFKDLVWLSHSTWGWSSCSYRSWPVKIFASPPCCNCGRNPCVILLLLIFQKISLRLACWFSRKVAKGLTLTRTFLFFFCIILIIGRYQ